MLVVVATAAFRKIGCKLSSELNPSVQERFVRVLQIPRDACAAVLDDGFVMTWGDACHGGDPRASECRAGLANVPCRF